MKVIAVMPAFEEASRIREAVLGVLPFVDQVIVVDDGSRDDTGEQAREAGAMVLRHAVNRGQGAALKTGTQAALRLGGQIIIHLDADGQHDAPSLPALIAPIREGKAEVVFGSRFLGVEAEGMPFTRRWMLMAGRVFSAYVLGVPYRVTDPQTGLRAMTGQAAHHLNFSQDRMAHCSEILRSVTRSSLAWEEVPTQVRYTSDALAKGQKSTDAFKIVWQLFLGAFQR